MLLLKKLTALCRFWITNIVQNLLPKSRAINSMVNTEQACYLERASVTIPGKNLQHLQVQVILNNSR